MKTHDTMRVVHIDTRRRERQALLNESDLDARIEAQTRANRERFDEACAGGFCAIDPADERSGCNGNCYQGRLCDCVSDVAADAPDAAAGARLADYVSGLVWGAIAVLLVSLCIAIVFGPPVLPR